MKYTISRGRRPTANYYGRPAIINDANITRRTEKNILGPAGDLHGPLVKFYENNPDLLHSDYWDLPADECHGDENYPGEHFNPSPPDVVTMPVTTIVSNPNCARPACRLGRVLNQKWADAPVDGDPVTGEDLRIQRPVQHRGPLKGTPRLRLVFQAAPDTLDRTSVFLMLLLRVARGPPGLMSRSRIA
ncbi:hypothetical protein EVAR_19348_1 [Eumeta japonica]|uniref:Uncharacterized protein n=1 Tax=Eumeta variegata TaxID=151549 RepID=A0A4C1TRE5_EUMVA|nr:hypothetical protein EVAR_19348_1 [Eumeta japonica]